MDDPEKLSPGGLDVRLTNALTEALAKTEIAISETENKGSDFVKKIWLAAEAAEYTSLIYSLAYKLEDYDPPVEKRRGEDPLQLLKNSLKILKQVMEKRARGATRNGYEDLRTAAEHLKAVYLDQTKVPTPRRATNAIRRKSCRRSFGRYSKP